MATATVGVLGVSYGATAVAAGLPVWFPVVLGATVLAASSEFVFVGLLAAGAGPLAAAVTGILLNLRHLPYGMSVSGVVGTGWQRAVSSHLVNDETVAFARAETTTAGRRAAFLVSGLGIVISWPLGALIGALAGSSMAHPATYGLDAVFPAILAALVLPALHDPATRRAALLGAAIALCTVPLLPAGLPVLGALVGLVASRQRRASS